LEVTSIIRALAPRQDNTRSAPSPRRPGSPQRYVWRIPRPARNVLVLEALLMSRRWKRRILLATTDQGLSSGTNFLLTILYAAWLPLESFGQYVILWTIVLFIEVV
jgi:hypothetical protein